MSESKYIAYTITRKIFNTPKDWKIWILFIYDMINLIMYSSSIFIVQLKKTFWRIKIGTLSYFPTIPIESK